MHTVHLLPSVAIGPILELKTRPKQLLGSLPLVMALPDLVYFATVLSYGYLLQMVQSYKQCYRCILHIPYELHQPPCACVNEVSIFPK